MKELLLTLCLIACSGIFWKGLVISWADMACAGFFGILLTMIGTLVHYGY